MEYAESSLSDTSDSKTATASKDLAKLKAGGDSLKLIDAVLDKNSSIGSALREQGGIWESIGNIASVADLRKLSAKDISAKYGYDNASAAAIEKELNTGDGENARRELAIGMATRGVKGETADGPTQDLRIAGHISNAARLLKETADILKVGGLVEEKTK